MCPVGHYKEGEGEGRRRRRRGGIRGWLVKSGGDGESEVGKRVVLGCDGGATNVCTSAGGHYSPFLLCVNVSSIGNKEKRRYKAQQKEKQGTHTQM